jgi:Flp pilus assembly protein TadG
LLRAGEQGQALVETAVALSVLLMVLTGIFAVSLVLYQYLTLNTAVTAGAISLAENQNLANPVSNACTAATTAIQNAAQSLNTANLSVAFYENGVLVSDGAGTCSGGLSKSQSVQVTATYPCSWPIFKTSLGSCTLTATSIQPAQ